MWPVLVAFFFCLCIVPYQAVQIIEFCPDPYLFDDADEYLVLSGHGTLDGISISDGNGGFRFPPGTSINGSVTVVRNSRAFEQTQGRPPDFEWQGDSPAVPDVINGRILRMANAWDSLRLYDNGKLVQEISWPEDVHPREGQVHFLEDGVWDRRPLLLGQSRLQPDTFRDVTVTIFVSPDCSSDVFFSAIDRARSTLLVNVYEFSSTTISAALIGAKQRGIDVDVLVEGGPVGGISPEEKTAIWQMNQSGIPVWEMAAPAGGHAPYRFDHAKYVVIDDQAVLLTSENFKQSGFPTTGVSGNRGWGVYLVNPELAGYFTTVYRTDLAGYAIQPVYGANGTVEPVPATTYAVKFTPAIFYNATVTPVISPDTSWQITQLLNSAETSIEIEQAYITNETATTLNPYLASAINASRRGVKVQVLLDSYWYNIEDEADNDEMAALVNSIAADEHLPLEARCADLAAGNVDKIHNKGVIVDDRLALVSSINWNSNSPNFNREAGAIIEHPGVAQYFHAVFDNDWAPAVHSSRQQTDYLKIAAVIIVVSLLTGLYYWRHIR
jgi:phosphatidylserine/phosphatidylglycerophosphate/cardiolipin synthase-like enzyme